MSTLLETIAKVRREVCDLHAELTRYKLVVWTAGNVSGRILATTSWSSSPPVSPMTS